MAAIARTIRASFCSLIISQRPEWLELLEGDRAQAGWSTNSRRYGHIGGIVDEALKNIGNFIENKH